MYSFIILPFFNLYLIFSNFLFLNDYIFKINLIWNNFKFTVKLQRRKRDFLLLFIQLPLILTSYVVLVHSSKGRSNNGIILLLLLLSCFSRGLTLCNPIDGSPPGSPIPGILQARILEWVAMLSSRGPSPPRD